jgi:hypothetical protein
LTGEINEPQRRGEHREIAENTKFTEKKIKFLSFNNSSSEYLKTLESAV